MTSPRVEILLVEDNAPDAFILRELVGEIAVMDIDITHVVRLGEALDALTRRRFDIIIVDLLLPDALGLETLRQVKGAAAETPIIVSSGVDAKNIGDAQELGVAAILPKESLDADGLQLAIERAISN